MYRNIMDDMTIWFSRPDRKMLYIKGAKGVGKTWSIMDFAAAFCDAVYLIDLSKEKVFRDVLSGDAGADDLDFIINEHYDNEDMTGGLVIFDEIQCVDGALKIIHEYSKLRSDLAVCAIASKASTENYEEEHKDEIQILFLKPMCFQEYLIANKENKLIEIIENLKIMDISPENKTKIKKYLREYLIVGGMPDVVKLFLKNHSYEEVYNKQISIIEDFERDIKKETRPAFCTRTRRILRSIPRQLEKDNKKFMFSLVEKNARNREYSEAVDYLCDKGICIKLNRVKEGKLPLDKYEEKKSYELFLLDNGLLYAIIKNKSYKNKEPETAGEIFSMLNGGFGEQFVMSELLGNPNVGNLYYWVSGATARVPLVFEGDNEVIPIDIRYTSNSKAQNLKVFKEKNKNALSMRLSIEDMYYEKNVLNIPVYGLWNF